MKTQKPVQRFADPLTTTLLKEAITLLEEMNSFISMTTTPSGRQLELMNKADSLVKRMKG